MRDRQPEPEALAGIGDAIERLEDPRMVLRRDALACVHDRDLDGFANVPGVQPDLALRMRDRVVDERGERLLKELGLRTSREGARAGDGDSSLAGRTCVRRHSFQQGAQLDRLERDALARLGAGKREQGPCDAGQTRRVLRDVPEEAVAVARHLLRAGLKHFDRRCDAGERGSQLMCGVSNELPHHLLAPQLLGYILDQEDGRIVIVCGNAGDPQGLTVGELDGCGGQWLRQRDEALGQCAELGSAERPPDLDRLAPEDAQCAVVREGNAAVAPDPDDRMRKPEEETAEFRLDQNVRMSPSAARSVAGSSGSSSGR